MPALQIQVEAREGLGIQITIAGDLDAHCVKSVEERLEEVAAGKPPRVVVDLSTLDYISSSGALCLLTSCRAMGEEGSSVVLVKPRGAIYEIFDLLGMTELLVFVPTLADAWAALQERPPDGR